ncbi:MAG: hypothetical protein BGO43_00020 [Gammaproteobacteria bacterium 39-13]|nr:hypothetical protein [Gammaproteobacteria bacterium]OJV96653.1 MAG: hypothetical protein BGO43_00020 [Gammaproteobacteria bacterium 39-13]
MKDFESKSSVCGVKVCTWGTHPGGGNGMGHYFDTEFFGGNVGHASIQVTFPADEKGAEWVKKYCLVPPIPYEKHKVQVKKAERDAKGDYQASQQNAFEEEVYVVTFTWFPGSAGYFLGTSINADGLSEREGVNTAWDPKWRQRLGIDPESRVHKGKIGSTEMTYGPMSVVHRRDLSKAIFRGLFEKSQDERKLSADIDSMAVLLEKMEQRVAALKVLEEIDQTSMSPSEQKKHNKEREKIAKVSQNEILILNKFFPGWEKNYAIEKHSIKEEEVLNRIIKDVNKKVEEALGKQKKIIEQREQEEKSIEQATDASKEFKKAEIQLTDTSFIMKGLVKNVCEILPYQPEQLLNELLDPESKLVDDGFPYKVDKGYLVECQDQIGKPWQELVANPTEDENGDINITLGEIKNIVSILNNQQQNTKNQKNYQDHILSEQLSKWESLRGSLLTLLNSNNSKDPNHNFDISSALSARINVAFAYFPTQRVKNSGKISRRELEDMLKIVDTQILQLGAKHVEVQAARESFKQNDFENYLTLGRQPDDVMHLPLNIRVQETRGHPHGMDVESMLQEMQAIAKEAENGKGFDLKKKNCSVTVGRILEAGAPNPHLKSQFRNKALGTIATPQMVLNNSKKYAEKMQKSPNDNFLKQVFRLSPLQAAMGWSVGKIMGEKTSKPMKVLAGIALIPILPIVGAIEGIKRAANPLKSFTQLYAFSQYANSKNSIGFKIGMACLYGPAMTLLAIPAGAQYTAKNAIKATSNLISKVIPAAFKKNKEEHIEVSNEERTQRTEATNALKEKMAVKEKMVVVETANLEKNEQLRVNRNILEISSSNPQRALALFQKVLKEYPNKIVILNKETTQLVEKYIHAMTPESAKEQIESEYRKLCDASMQRAKGIADKPMLRQTLLFTHDSQKENGDSATKKLEAEMESKENITIEDTTVERNRSGSRSTH